MEATTPGLYDNLSEYNQQLFDQWVKKADFAKVGLKTTVCLLTLENGFEIVGTSACVDPAMFDSTLGKQYSLVDALNELDAHNGFYRQVLLSQAVKENAK
jgi:hypothetical protein